MEHTVVASSPAHHPLLHAFQVRWPDELSGEPAGPFGDTGAAGVALAGTAAVVSVPLAAPGAGVVQTGLAEP
ncbi:hypothetical protein [Arthrobacter oryzae]|uniref:hypothetical protein n=1 Tax=Arthrobacter oryzae TaxID=409290 RepID=UPI00277F7D66|nr:hypothetical protein [Arthrobacter oryzae]MDQ0079496.1 hypothetical protein [Arthrobacter oryzae]